MFSFSIGVMLESFRTDIRSALTQAKLLGAQGIQVYATDGELAPERMTPEKRREFRRLVAEEGLVISALCGDLGRGFGNPEQNPELIERSKRILDLAKDLGTDIVTTHIGVIPQDSGHPRYGVMQQACFALAEYADSLAAHFAIETGPEPAQTLRNFLDQLGSTGVAVNLDPANFVMVTGDDPTAAVGILRDYIVHTHAKDGKRLYVRSPEEIYGLTEPEMLQSPSFIELPLGEGSVDFDSYLAALDAIGYHGFLTIEREVGEDPAADIARAVTFLREKIGERSSL